MHKVNSKVENYLKDRFDKVRRFENGFKINKLSLSDMDLKYLNFIPAYVEISIKRSGTGLLIVIT